MRSRERKVERSNEALPWPFVEIYASLRLESEEEHIRYLYRDSIGSIGMRGKKSAVITSDFFTLPLFYRNVGYEIPAVSQMTAA